MGNGATLRRQCSRPSSTLQKSRPAHFAPAVQFPDMKGNPTRYDERLCTLERGGLRFHMIPTMLRRLCALLLVAVGSGLGQVTVPNTPAGKTLQAWLNAFNSGDRGQIQMYVKTVDQSQSIDGMISFRNQTGGFESLSIESS